MCHRTRDSGSPRRDSPFDRATSRRRPPHRSMDGVVRLPRPAPDGGARPDQRQRGAGGTRGPSAQRWDRAIRIARPARRADREPPATPGAWRPGGATGAPSCGRSRSVALPMVRLGQVGEHAERHHISHGAAGRSSVDNQRRRARNSGPPCAASARVRSGLRPLQRACQEAHSRLARLPALGPPARVEPDRATLARRLADLTPELRRPPAARRRGRPALADDPLLGWHLTVRVMSGSQPQ